MGRVIQTYCISTLLPWSYFARRRRWWGDSAASSEHPAPPAERVSADAMVTGAPLAGSVSSARAIAGIAVASTRAAAMESMQVFMVNLPVGWLIDTLHEHSIRV
jgi:hypothetical protein